MVQAHTGAAKVWSFWVFLGKKSAQSRHKGSQNVPKGTPRPEEEAEEVTGGGKEEHKASQERKSEIWGVRGPHNEPYGNPGPPPTPPCRQSLVGAPPQSLCRDSESETLKRLYRYSKTQ